MRLIWLLPSVISGLVFALATGHPTYLLFSGTSVAAAALVALLTSRKRSAQTGDTQLIKVDGRWFLAAEPVTRMRLLFKPALRRSLLEQLRVRSRAPDWGEASAAFDGPPHDQPRLGISISVTELRPSVLAVELPWRENPHALVIGPTGSGKTVLLRRIVDDCLRLPGVRVWFFDFKNGGADSLSKLAPTHRLSFASTSESTGLSRLWEELMAQLNWSGARPNRPQQVSDVVVVDELAVALEHPESRERILQLASQGRSAGVRLICASQSTAGVPRALMANLMNRIVVGQPDQADLLVLLSRTESLGHREPPPKPPEFGESGRWLSGRLFPAGQDFVFPLKT